MQRLSKLFESIVFAKHFLVNLSRRKGTRLCIHGRIHHEIHYCAREVPTLRRYSAAAALSTIASTKQFSLS